MDQLLRLKRPAGLKSPLMLYDPAQEKLLRSLQPRSEICAEENKSRLENRRFSDVLPQCQESAESQVNSHIFETNKAVCTSAALHNHNDPASPRIASAPLPGNVGHHFDNRRASLSLHLLGGQSTLDQFDSYTTALPPIAPATCGIDLLPTSQHPKINTTLGGSRSVMTGAHIPPPFLKSRPYHHLASHTLASSPKAASYVPREDSTSSLASLKARDNSIRIVKPNLTLSPPRELEGENSNRNDIGHPTACPTEKSQETVMNGSNQNGHSGKSSGEESRTRFKSLNEHSHSHSRSMSQDKRSLDAPQGNADKNAGSLMAQPESSAENSTGRSKSVERGRTMQRRYEFIDSDDKARTLLSPVHETGKKNNDKGNSEGVNIIGRESNVTTVTDLMRRCIEPSPPKLPTRRDHGKQQVNQDAGASVTQSSLPQPKPKHRPPPLNLKDPVYLGRVKHRDRYEIEHIAVESSKAEVFDWYGPKTNLSPFEDNVESPPCIAPLNIPNLDTLRGVDPLQLYDEWRKNLKPVRTASQSSIRVTFPIRDEDTVLNGKRFDHYQLPIADHPIVQEAPIVNHVRSRSTLGIRENRDREERNRQFSAGTVYTASEYSATPLGPPSSIIRSATMRDVSHPNRHFSNGSVPKAGQHAATVNGAPLGTETERLSPLYTPLTPFIMRATGAPAGAEGGSKTLFGEHGWLEDTAASGAAKPKLEKIGGFMENLKRKAREIADSTSFKPVRNIRPSTVNRLNISLDAREQSLLYCELEYNLNNALDAYIKAQLNCGRLEPSKLSRVADLWAQKGRPKVVSFRYDLETQVDLIAAHIENFRFYGPLQAEGPAAIAGLLYAMKTNARYMRVRTFCQPDSVIAKHVLDSQNLLRLLGSPESLQRPLEEVAQFFKVAVDRHKTMTEAPAARRAGARAASNASGRVISNGSGQRVRFHEQNGARTGYYLEVPVASKSRPDVRDPN